MTSYRGITKILQVALQFCKTISFRQGHDENFDIEVECDLCYKLNTRLHSTDLVRSLSTAV